MKALAFVHAGQKRRGPTGDDQEDINELNTRSFKKRFAGGRDGELVTTQAGGEGRLAAVLSRLTPQAQEVQGAAKMATRRIGGGTREAKSFTTNELGCNRIRRRGESTD